MNPIHKNSRRNSKEPKFSSLHDFLNSNSKPTFLDDLADVHSYFDNSLFDRSQYPRRLTDQSFHENDKQIGSQMCPPLDTNCHLIENVRELELNAKHLNATVPLEATLNRTYELVQLEKTLRSNKD
jgi:hypothetical protein